MSNGLLLNQLIRWRRILASLDFSKIETKKIVCAESWSNENSESDSLWRYWFFFVIVALLMATAPSGTMIDGTTILVIIFILCFSIFPSPARGVLGAMPHYLGDSLFYSLQTPPEATSCETSQCRSSCMVASWHHCINHNKVIPFFSRDEATPCHFNGR